MKALQYLLIVLPLMATTACRTDVKLGDGRHVPKEPKFSIQPQEHSRSGLDFNAVYYDRHQPPTNSNLIETFNYLRFWPDGRVLQRALDHLPTKLDAEDFSSAYIGYYSISNENPFTELFVPSTAYFRWDYCRSRFLLKNDEIILISEELGSERLMNRRSYRKLIFDSLNRGSDW